MRSMCALWGVRFHGRTPAIDGLFTPYCQGRSSKEVSGRHSQCRAKDFPIRAVRDHAGHSLGIRRGSLQGAARGCLPSRFALESLAQRTQRALAGCQCRCPGHEVVT